MDNKEDVYRNPQLDLNEIRETAGKIAEEVIEKGKLQPGMTMVIGCSTSVICGDLIGTNSALEVARATFSGIYEVLSKHKIYPAAQCCEHLNRAIITEREAVIGAELCQVVPRPKAGGSFATCAYYVLKDPVALEEIKADAGIDIGGTLIGMHLKRVAVPIKLENDMLGSAHVVAAYTRPKYIGGERAGYEFDQEMADRIRG